jgi:hypothetical protein
MSRHFLADTRLALQKAGQEYLQLCEESESWCFAYIAAEPSKFTIH